MFLNMIKINTIYYKPIWYRPEHFDKHNLLCYYKTFAFLRNLVQSATEL
jgi:hypothetical protein